MTNKKTIQQLEKAKLAIEKAIASLEESNESGDVVGTCLFRKEPLYENAKSVRGLCLACYSLLKKKVEKGETTWEELVRKNQALPEAKSGRKKIDINTIEVEEALDSLGEYRKSTLVKKKRTDNKR
jgi:hypothetical protein